MDHIDFHSMKKKVNTVEVNGPINCLITNILQNISFVFNRRKKFIQAWKNFRVSK